MELIIDKINEKSPILQKVKELWRINSKTLGFFPEGAFEDYAAKGGLLIARDQAGNFYGYLLFRTVFRGGILPICVIVHLCVNNSVRKKNIARKLLSELNSLTNSFLKIELNCRRDFEANDFWPKVGFTYNREVEGRSGLPLVNWVRQISKLPLMAILEREGPSKMQAVIDMNILFRLQDPLPVNVDENLILAEEAKALLEDLWKKDVELLITPETFNEIERNRNAEHRKMRLQYAKQFLCTNENSNEIDIIRDELYRYFPKNGSYFSDITQIAHSIQGGADFFLTQDTKLEKKDSEIFSQFGLRIMRPGKFIGYLDENLREKDNHPKRLAGSPKITIKSASGEKILDLFNIYKSNHADIKRKSFETRISYYLSKPQNYSIEICHLFNSPIAFIIYDRTNPDELLIPIIEVKRSSIANTLFRYLLRRSLSISTQEQRSFTIIEDICEYGLALEEIGFTKVENTWLKLNLNFVPTMSQLSLFFSDIKNQKYDENKTLFITNIINEFNELFIDQNIYRLVDLERRLWPFRIIDANIPSFVVPIKPVWAMNLFDEENAGQSLLGGSVDLILRNENIYYRSTRNGGGISYPARIIWYITKDSNFGLTSKQLRACSSLDEVVVNCATNMFRRFDRLGVYEWKNIMKMVDNDPLKEIMALKFSNTELFCNPVDLQTYTNILMEEENKKPVLQSPQRIKPNTFARLYQSAFQQVNGDL